MKKGEFKKGAAKKRSLIKLILITFFVLVLLIGVISLIVGLKNIIEYSNENEDSKLVSQDVATSSTPIVMNNVVLGAVSDKKWVASEKFFFYGNNTVGNKLDVYTAQGKKGSYQVEGTDKNSNGTVFITTTNSNKNDEYIAVATSDDNVMPQPAIEIETITEQDYKKAKSGLGMYRLLNPSIDIKNAYNVRIDGENSGIIYVITSRVKKYLGGYSAIVYSDYNDYTKLIKYSYVADLNNSSDWPIYSFKFLVDLNKDGKNEIVLQETKENKVEYDVIEYNNGKFTQVLTSSIDI